MQKLGIGAEHAKNMEQAIRDSEAKYQDSRGENSGKFDGARMIGGAINPINASIAAFTPAGAGLGTTALLGAAAGGASGLLQPIYGDEDFSSGKLKQAGIGAATGAAVPLAFGGLARIVSPKASVNPNLQLLKNEGVQPTIGQTLGGRWNSLEEKLTSVPILGDAISSARNRSLNQFNNAAINRATSPIGQKVEGVGLEGVKKAGDALSGAYTDAVDRAGGLQLDDAFSAVANRLRVDAQSLPADYARRFAKLIGDAGEYTVDSAGKMSSKEFNRVDSLFSKEIAKTGKDSNMFAQDYTGMVKEMQTALRDALERQNPAQADLLKGARSGWANLVRVEQAAKSAKNNDGVFTPGQLNMAIQATDNSVRKRAVSRGDALMQDLGNAGQSVFGNKVPNSFTTDRALIAGGTLGSYFLNPAIPAGLLGGAAMYTPPMQKLLTGMVSSRPEGAQTAAKLIEQFGNRLIPFVAGAQLAK
ncbi:MAG: hypothetical protein H6R01_428 [Burkholderiaceae bacterium]|nr:hypothetical protein [Burkholderiaceae bacterium]